MSRVQCSNCDAFGHSFQTCDQPFDKQRVADKELAKAVRRQQREERVGLINAEFVTRGMAHLQRPILGQSNQGQGAQPPSVQPMMQNMGFTQQSPLPTLDIPPTTPPKVWRLRWGTFVCSRVEEKDFAERFKGLRGFISWFPSDPWDGCVFVEFANEDDAKTAKLLLGGMCFTDASGALQVCQVGDPVMVQPRTEEEQQKCKRPRVDEPARSDDPEFVALRQRQADQEKRMQDLHDRIEGTNTRITSVVGQLGQMASAQKVRDLESSREWHTIGEFDYAAKHVMKGQAKRVQKGENLYLVHPNDDDTGYIVLHGQVSDIQSRNVGFVPYENGTLTDLEHFSTKNWVFREVEAATTAMGSMNSYIQNMMAKRNEIINQVAAME